MFKLFQSPKFALIPLIAGLTGIVLANSAFSANYHYRISVPNLPPSTWPSCETPWGDTLAHNGNVFAYSSESVPFGNSCDTVKQERTCNKGVLSGDFTYPACNVADEVLTIGTPAVLTLYDPFNQGYTISPSYVGFYKFSRPWFATAHTSTCKSSGKWYWEVQLASGSGMYIGISANPQLGITGSANSDYLTNTSVVSNTSILVNGTGVAPVISSVVNKKLGFAMDLDARQLYLTVDGVPQTPNGVTIPAGCMRPTVWNNTSNPAVYFGGATFNFGGSSFTYAVPSGYHPGLDQ